MDTQEPKSVERNIPVMHACTKSTYMINITCMYKVVMFQDYKQQLAVFVTLLAYLILVYCSSVFPYRHSMYRVYVTEYKHTPTMIIL